MTQGFLLVMAPDGGAEAEAVLLVVSELVTNAVQHADGVTGFGLQAGPGTVTVIVEDASRLPPRLLPLEPGRPGGFEWQMGIVAGESGGGILTLTCLQLCRDGVDISRLLPARPSSCPTPRPGGHT